MKSAFKEFIVDSNKSFSGRVCVCAYCSAPGGSICKTYNETCLRLPGGATQPIKTFRIQQRAPVMDRLNAS